MHSDSDKLERLIARTLREQPLMPAPRALETRVLNELARRAALPGWRKGFMHWPVTARIAFLLACAGFIKVALTAAGWLYEATKVPVASVQDTARLASSLAQTGEVLIHVIPSQWIYLAAAFGIALYVALFGLGAAAYRTIYK